MTEQGCIPGSGISKAQRNYTVAYVPNQGDTSTPNIHLKGKWLREERFETGAHLHRENNQRLYCAGSGQ